MYTPGFDFQVARRLHKARLTRLTTPHGVIDGPFFQFVATQAGVRGQVYSEDLEKLGVQVVLANTYHLHLRPGEAIIAKAGGLHDFMQWAGPLTTDSGGYQVFSLGSHVDLEADGVTFRSPLDGSTHRLTPENVLQIQTKLGADLIMPLDVCTPHGADHATVAAAVAQTHEWAKRCQAEHERLTAERHVPQVLYGIVQGGVYPDLREHAAAGIRELDFFGYSIGGEMRDVENNQMDEGVRMTVGHLPADAPRYLMGAGAPEDIVRAVRAGVDHFDCVLPIRNARHGRLYQDLNVEELTACLTDPERPVEATSLYTTLNLRQGKYATDFSLFAADNPAVGRDYSLAYLHHLLKVEPPSGYRLAVLNNIHFYVRLFETIRQVIREHTS